MILPTITVEDDSPDVETDTDADERVAVQTEAFMLGATQEALDAALRALDAGSEVQEAIAVLRAP